MATLDPFNVLQQQEHTPIPTAPSPKVDVPNGTPSMWQRIQQVGIGKVNLLNAGRMAKATAISTGKAAIGAGEDISNAIGNTEVRVGAKLGIKAKTGTQTPTQQFGKKAGSYAGTTAKEKIGNIAQTALLGLPGGGKAVEVTAADLLKTFGTQGVRDLADKAGVDIGGKGAIEGAKAVAGTKVAQQAFKKATTNVVTKTVKTSAKSAAGFGAFSAAGEASAGGSNKQIVKAGEQGAVIGAVAGGLASGSRSIAKAKSGNAAVEGVTKGKAPSEGPSPVTKLEAKATARQKADQALAPPKTKLLGPGTGKAEGKGFTMSSSPDANKVKISARLNAINKQLNAHAQGTKVLPPDQLKALVAEKDSLNKGASSPPVKVSQEKTGSASTPINKTKTSGQGSVKSTSVATPVEPDSVATTKAKTYFANKEKATADYQAHTMKEFKVNKPNVVSADSAKFIVDGGKMDVKNSVAYHEPSSQFTKDYYKTLLADKTTKDQKVLFSAGGTGAGKTHSLTNLEGNRLNHYAAIVDTNLKDVPGSIDKIDRALSTGRQVRIVYVYRHPVDAFRNGVLPRAEKTGRTIQVDTHAGTHIGSMDTIQKLAQHYKDNPNVEIRVVDNSGSKLSNPVKPLDFLKGKEHNKEELTGKLHNELDQAHRQGKISPETYHATRGGDGRLSASDGQGLTKGQEARPVDERGGVAPGAVSKDIQDYLAKNQKVNQATGDIKRDSQIHENAQKQRLIDSASLLKKVKGYSNFDKTAVYNYREAKAAGTDLPKLNARQQALHNIVTEIVRATNQNKSELAKLKAPGYSEDKIFDPESGNHRMAVGKGSSFERFLGGAQRTPLGARSLRTTTSSSKARVWYAITDKEGNRSVAAIKNVSIKQGMRNVPKGKFVDRIEEQGASTRLGKITPQELKDGSFKGRDGNTYTVSQATSEEISKATHQEYFRNPLVNAVIDYHETASALDSARMLEKWKGSEDFHNIAMKIGEGTPPRKWTTTKLPQMQGYHFEPKVAETLDDIYGRIQNKNDVLSAVNHLLKQTMVAVPIRHNLNELGFYFTDRGLSGMINPFKIYRGSANLVKAFNSVMNMDENYRTVMSSGFNFMYHDDKAFSDQINNQMKSMLDDTKISARLAGDLGIPVQKLRSAWNAIQHKGVWFQQDVLNMARIYDRAGKSGDLISAANETQRFNPQYRVPSRVAGSRSASIILRNNNILFFGSYHYDQWKVLANILGDLSGRNGIKGAAQSVDKLAALSLGVWATQALVDKGLQKISGDPNAYTKAPGVLDLPQQLYQLATGQKDISTFAQSQLFPSIGLSTVAQVFENRDFFTGKNIRDANTAPSDQVKQLGKWLESQLPTSQQVQNVKKGGNVTAGVLALSGARFPKNSPQVNDLNSLKYDTLPNVQSVAKKQAQAGDISGAQKTISQYDKLVLNATKNALKTAGKPVPSDSSLIKQLIKQQYYYAPKSATIKKWSTEKQTSVLDRIK